MFQNGWKPRWDHHSYVTWVPRKHNAAADYVANVALDKKQSYDSNPETNEAFSGHVLVMSDGGFRGAEGSAAWTIYDVWEGSLEITQFSYMHLSTSNSSFECEMIAISEAISKVCKMISGRRKIARTS